MKPIRLTDGYTETGAIPQGAMVELFFTFPDSDQVLPVHLTARLAFRLALWLLAYWIIGRWWGVKDRKDLNKAREALLTEPGVEYGDT